MLFIGLLEKARQIGEDLLAGVAYSWRLGGLKRVVGEWYCFVFDSFKYFEPMMCLAFWVPSQKGVCNSVGECVLNSLEAVNLGNV